MARTLVILGLILLGAGLLWPLLARLGLGHLPGDITIRRPHFHFYLPLTSSILISIVLSLIIWIVSMIRR